MLSLLIACLELVFLINLFIFSEKNKLNTVAKVLISILMIYQLLEFTICRTKINNHLIIYFAFSLIAFLPPLALLFVLCIKDIKHKLIKFIFLPPIFFTIFYLFQLDNFSLVECNSMYSIYKYPFGDLYGLFYYVPIIISIILLVNEIIKHRRKELIVVLIGFVIISLPVIIAFILKFIGDGRMVTSIVSVMCKSAFFFAFSLFYFALNNKMVKSDV